LDPKNWRKSPEPLFSGDATEEGKIFTVGHNGFFKSPDGSEDWIVYHGKDVLENHWRNRTARAQKFTWKADGTPDFGQPLPTGVALAEPAGERPE
jgi:GH43 family beta-xylosidase